MVELFSLHKSKLELQTYGLLHTRNFLYHVLAFRLIIKEMKITKLIWKLIIIGLKHGNINVIYKAVDNYCWLDDKSIHVKNDMQINKNKSVIINPFEPVF